MIDLTPLEVRKKKGDFKRAMRGYDPGMVDDFLELVADRLEELVRANLAHDDRVRQLEQQLRDYKERERALTDALVSAQELREEMREQALRDAEAARREAEQEAEQIRTNVAQEIEREEQSLRRLRARQAQLAQSYRALLEREMEELEVMTGGIAYRAGLDEEVDAPRRDAAPRRDRPESDAARQDSAARVNEPAHAPPRESPVSGPGAVRDEPVAEARYSARAVPSQAMREAPASYGAAAGSIAATEQAPDARSAERRDDRPVAREASEDSQHEGEEVDDEALERSLEALQVVFARDEAQVRHDWPLPGAARTAPVSAASAHPEPALEEEPDAVTPSADQRDTADAVPVALEEDSLYGEELLLEDAIDEEDEVEEDESPVAAVVEPWLPKLIEDAP